MEIGRKGVDDIYNNVAILVSQFHNGLVNLNHVELGNRDRPINLISRFENPIP